MEKKVGVVEVNNAKVDAGVEKKVGAVEVNNAKVDAKVDAKVGAKVEKVSMITMIDAKVEKKTDAKTNTPAEEKAEPAKPLSALAALEQAVGPAAQYHVGCSRR